MDGNFLFHLLAAVVVGAAACAWATHRRRDVGLARGFAVAAMVLGAVNLLLVVLRSFGSDSLQQMARAVAFPSGIATTWIVGIALAFCAASLTGALRTRAIAWCASGAAVHAALSFLAFEAGKLAHDAEMRAFFTGSGFPVWFMYVVMGVETLAALALFSPRTRVPAAAMLALVMLGAIGTHWHNGDPVGDSLDAIRMLVLVLTVLAFSRLSGFRTPRPLAMAGRFR